MEEEKKEQPIEEEKKELNLDDLELVAGGDWTDDVACFFGSHEWSVLQSVHGTNVPLVYLKQKCDNCGKIRYIMKNTETEDYKTVDEYAFDHADEMFRMLDGGLVFKTK